MKWFVFARWSVNHEHYELFDTAESEAAANKLADDALGKGALQTRVEVREAPSKKGGKDAPKV